MFEDLKKAKQIAKDYFLLLQQINNGEDVEFASLAEYFYDAQFSKIISQNGDLLGYSVILSYGGPAAWVNTEDNTIFAATRGETAGYAIPQELSIAIDEAIEMSYHFNH